MPDWFPNPASSRRSPAATAAALAILVCAAAPSSALRIELDDVAPDRIERQRTYAIDQQPLPGTPDTSQLDERLERAGLKLGAPVFIRIFKEESEIELWIEKNGRFVKFATYPVCHWSGTLGPKLAEGDRQTPEGFYAVTHRKLHRSGRWPRSLNLGYPNALDRTLKRTGSYILIHGGCTSTGCYAMTDAASREIFNLASQALRAGAPRIEVHAFPFHMTDENMQRHRSKPSFGFWRDLKPAYDAFAATAVPPKVTACAGRYHVQQANVFDTTTREPGAKPATRRGRSTSGRRFASYPPASSCEHAGTVNGGASASAYPPGEITPAP